MSSTMVQYTVKAGRGDENQQLIEQVFAELAKEAPPGFHYTAFRSEDGQTFVHVVTDDTHDAGETLRSLPAFRAFRAGLDERCAIAPVRTQLTTVASYSASSLPLHELHATHP